MMELLSKSQLKENRIHGDEAFPLAVYWINQHSNEASILDCHWHQEAEFFYCLEGEVLFQVESEYFIVKAGEAVFIDSGEIHAGHSSNQSSCMFGAIVFNPSILASASYDAIHTQFIIPFLNKTATFPRHIKPESSWEKTMLQQLRSILSEYDQQDFGYELAIKATLYLLLQHIVKEGRAVNRSQSIGDLSKSDKLKKAITYIYSHYHQPMKIADIAEQIPMSEGQFCRFFKFMTRQTPVEFINAYRIKKAALLLLETNYKISSIAYEVGFEHISYFVKVFRQQMNCSPSEFRKQK